jgi:hypothetical protein
MIEVEESAELLTLRVRPRMPKTSDEEQGPRNHHQQGWQIPLAEEEIRPKNRSHPLEIHFARHRGLFPPLLGPSNCRPAHRSGLGLIIKGYFWSLVSKLRI